MRQIRNKIKYQMRTLEKEESFEKVRPYLKDRYLTEDGCYHVNKVNKRLHQILYRTVRSEVARIESVMINLRDISIARNTVTRLEGMGI